MKKIKLFLALGLMLLALNAQAGKTIDLSEFAESSIIEISDGDTVIGTLDVSCQLRINYVNPTEKCTVLLDNVNIYPESGSATMSSFSGLSCMSGDVTLIIKDECVVNTRHLAAPAIFIKEGCKLTIQEHEEGGELYAKSLNASAYSAGIGGTSNGSGGELIIKSGKITAQGAAGAPGIGAGTHQTSGSFSTFGDITIEGGEVTAIGGADAAGIGAGKFGKCGRILIKGGNVTAKGGANAPGLGCGAGSGSYCQIISVITQKGVKIYIQSTKGAGAPYSVGKSTSGTCGSIAAEGVGIDQERFTDDTWYYDGTAGKNIDGLWYYLSRVTETVVCDGRVDDKLTDIVIKDKAEFTYSYPVISIGANKFQHDNIETVFIPASIQKIWDNAFANCTSMKEIKCEATVPPTLAAGAFANLPKTAIIRVPNDKIDTYKAADGWKDFALQIRGLVYTAKQEIDGINYSLNLDNETATVIALDDSKKYKDTVVIPLTVKYENKEYDVKEISDDAFYENNELKGVDIPSSVEKIGKQSFGYCTGLNFVICRISTAPAIYFGTFQNVNAGGQKPLYVEESSYDDYNTFEHWKEFDVRSLEVYDKRMELKGIVAEMYNLLNDGIGILTDEEMEPISVTAIPAALTVANDESSALTQAKVDAAIATATKALNDNEAAFLTKAKDHVKSLKADLVLMKNSADALGAKSLANTIQGEILVLAASEKETMLGKVRDAYVTAKGQLDAHKSELVEAARAALIDQLSALLTVDDSQECIDIIDNYIANVNAQIVWSDAMTVEQNIHDNAINASVYLTQAKTELETQRAHDTKQETCDFTAKATKHSYYNDVWIYNGIWDIRGGANNNGGWEYAKMGGRKDYMADYSNVYVANKAAFSFEVKHIEVSFANGSLSKNGMSVTEWGVKVYSDDTFEDSKLLYTVKGKNEDIKKGEATVAQLVPEAGKPWLAGYGYRVYWDVANTTTTNGVVCVEKICFSNQGPATGIEEITNDQSPMTNKIIKNGQLFIIRDGKTYNAQGIMVK